MIAEGLLVFILSVVGLILAILWTSVPFMLYSIKSSLQVIEETLDDLREIDLEIARRLGPLRSAPAEEPQPAAPSEDEPLERPLRQPRGPAAPRQPGSQQSSLRNQAEQSRRRLQD